MKNHTSDQFKIINDPGLVDSALLIYNCCKLALLELIPYENYKKNTDETTMLDENNVPVIDQESPYTDNTLATAEDFAMRIAPTLDAIIEETAKKYASEYYLANIENSIKLYLDNKLQTHIDTLTPSSTTTPTI
jgi:hypothetical protein